MSILSERLKELRLKNNLTQIEISEIINIQRATYGMYEIDKSVPKSETLQKLADYYNVSIDYLLGNDLDKIDIIIRKTTELTEKNIISWLPCVPPKGNNIRLQLQFNEINQMLGEISFNYNEPIREKESYYHFGTQEIYMLVTLLSQTVLHIYSKTTENEKKKLLLEIHSYEKNLNHLYNVILKSQKPENEEILNHIINRLKSLEEPPQ